MKQKINIERELKFLLEMCVELKEQVKLVEVCLKDTLKKLKEESK